MLPTGPSLVVLPEHPVEVGTPTPPPEPPAKTPDAGNGTTPAQPSGTGVGTSAAAMNGAGSATSTTPTTGGAGGTGNATDGTTGIRMPVTRPSYARTPLPDYPRTAKNNHWEGLVLLRVEVLKNGCVGRVELAQSSGHDVLDESAIRAVHYWRFHPAKHGDTPIACFINVPVRFKLDDAGA